jgi:hypothetical protein
MAIDNVGDIIPVPSYNEAATFSTDLELQYSTVGFTQKGATLKPGQGVLALGTILAKDPATRKYVKYTGTGDAVGVLRTTVDTGADAAAPGRQGNVVIAGILNLGIIADANGSSALAAGVTALGARTSDVLGTFKF